MKVIIINSLNELNEIIYSEDNDYLYRGQSDSAWGLTPSVCRKDTEGSINNIKKYISDEQSRRVFDFGKILKKNELRRLEIGLLLDFIKYSHQVSLRLPSGTMGLYEKYIYESLRNVMWPKPEDLDVLSIMQHYGFPTRLLDWSNNILTALFFSSKPNVLQDSGANYFSVWQLDQKEFIKIKKGIDTKIKRNSRLKKQHINKSYKDIIELVVNLKIFKSDSEINKNLGAQKGCFTYIKNHNSAFYKSNDDFRITHDEYMERIKIELTNLVEPTNEVEMYIYQSVYNLSKLLVKYDIRVDLAFEVIKLLQKLGCNQSTLFPNYESILDQIELDVAMNFR